MRVGRVEPELSCAATAGATASETPIANATSMAMRRTVDVMTVLGAVVVRGSATLPRGVLQPRNRHRKARDGAGGSGRRGPGSAPAGFGAGGYRGQATLVEVESSESHRKSVGTSASAAMPTTM